MPYDWLAGSTVFNVWTINVTQITLETHKHTLAHSHAHTMWTEPNMKCVLWENLIWNTGCAWWWLIHSFPLLLCQRRAPKLCMCEPTSVICCLSGLFIVRMCTLDIVFLSIYAAVFSLLQLFSQFFLIINFNRNWILASLPSPTSPTKASTIQINFHKIWNF